eukprot:253901_1
MSASVVTRSKPHVPTTTAAVALFMDESSSDDDVPTCTGSNNQHLRYPIDHYANQYRINKNAKHRRKPSHHQHSNECKTTKCGVDINQSTHHIPNLKQLEVMRMRRYGQFFAIFVPLLYTTFSYYSLLYVLPNIPFLVIFQDETDPQKLILFRVLFGTFCIILITLWYWSYLKAKYAHPGPIPQSWREWNGNPMTRPSDPIYAVKHSHSLHGTSMIITKNSRLYCSKCRVFRPNRTGHCKRCNICVTRIDHHCTFLNNCVGSNNQRYFIQFIIYSALSWLLYLCCTPFAKHNIKTNLFYEIQWNGHLFMLFYVLPTVAFGGLIGLLFLIIGQMRSIINNQTFTESKFRTSDDRTTTNGTNTKPSCWKAMKEAFERGRNKRENRMKNEEERKGLLEDIDVDEKDESEEVVVNTDSATHGSMDEGREYDCASKWNNIQTVLGRSMIHWFIPLDWTEDELYERMLTRSFSFELLPSFVLTNKLLSHVKRYVVHES